MGVTESHDLKQEIRKILDCQADAEPSLEFETWRLVHKFVHAHPCFGPGAL